MRGWLRRRARRESLHGRRRVGRQRLVALLMIVSGLLRCVVWAGLILLYLAHVAAVRKLYSETSFVSILSVGALLLTDWGQVAASLAQLTAGDAHHDAEATREAVGVGVDFARLRSDVLGLAASPVGETRERMAAEICRRLPGPS